MKIQKQHAIGIFIPVLLFLFVVAVDLEFFSVEMLPFVPNQLREVILGVALALFVWGTSRLDWFRDRALLQKLWFLGICVVVLWSGMRLLELRMSSDLTSWDESVDRAVHSFGHPLWTILFLGVVVLSVWIFVTLKELIFVQQGKKTERNFRFLLIFIFLQMAYNLAGGKERVVVVPSNWGVWYGDTILENIFFAFVILFGFINGFRCKWIHYLNKRQKVGVFFLGGLLTPLALFLLFRSSDTIQNYSVVVGTFANSLVWFYVIYSGMALLGTLFQLPSAGLMDRRIREIRSLQALSATIGSIFNMEELVSKTTELALRVVGADFSWVELKEGSTYRLAGSRGVRQEDVEKIPDSVRKGIRKEVAQQERALLINHLSKNKMTAEIKKWRPRVGSLLAARIQFKKKEMGILYALKSETFGFVEESRGLFQAFADQVAMALGNVHLIQVTIEQEVYHEELKLAHDAQMRLLPREMPQLKGVELDGFCMTANEIGGDFYDVIQVSKERLDVVVGDVSGKGPSAAFYMAELKGVIQALAPHFSSPKKILIEVNKFLRNHFEKDTFVTMVYGIFLPAKKQIHLARAGHPPVGLVRKDGVSWLETKGIGLGLDSDAQFGKRLEQKVVPLNKGDALFLYTDGLIEARNRKGEEFGEEMLGEMLQKLHDRGAEEMVTEIRQELETFTKGVSRHDDVTLVALRIST